MQEVLRVKKAKKKQRDPNRCEETLEEYKAAKKVAKKAIPKAKPEAYKDLYDRYDSLRNHEEGLRRAIRIAKQKDRESKDVHQSKQMKDASGVVLTEEAEIRES